MSESEASDERLPGRREIWILILAILVIGAIGFQGYARTFHDRHPLSLLFHTLQMFVLESPELPENGVPASLLIARVLAGILSFWVALRIFLSLLKRDWLQFNMRRYRDHIVLCGLGKLGLALALEARKHGKPVIAIERNPSAPGVAKAREAGVLVLFGDAGKLQTLRRAQAHYAREILALCADETNMAIAALVAQWKPGPESLGAQVRCRIAVSHPALRESLRNKPNLYRDAAQVETQDLDISEMRARQAFNEFPLDFRALPEPAPGRMGKAATLVLIGFGEMGQALALQAARIGIFASGEKPRVRVVDKEADSRLATFRGLVPRYMDLCDLRTLGPSLDAPGVLEGLRRLVEEAKGGDDPVTVAVCGDDDDAGNFSQAMKLSHALGQALCLQILVYFTTENGFSQSLPAGGFLKPFGMREKVWNHQTLLEESLDTVAKHLHEAYRKNEQERREKHKREGKPEPARKPADLPWEWLPERFRISNRSSADHISVKARALGFRVSRLGTQPAPTGERITEFKDKTEMLAKLEHRRWYANHWLDGWTYDPDRDDSKLLHNMLKSWDDLKPDDRYIDVNMVAAASQALEKAGLGIFR